MPYTSNRYAPKARRLTVNLVKVKRLKKAVVARMFGVHRATIGKWIERADPDHRVFIRTVPPRPHNHPNQIPQTTIDRLVALAVAAFLESKGLYVYLRFSTSEGYPRREAFLWAKDPSL